MQDVAVDIQFTANTDDVESEGVAAQIDLLPETDGYARWCHGRLEVPHCVWMSPCVRALCRRVCEPYVISCVMSTRLTPSR